MLRGPGRITAQSSLGEWANKSAGTGQTRQAKLFIFLLIYGFGSFLAPTTCRPKSNNVSRNQSNESPDRSGTRSVGQWVPPLVAVTELRLQQQFNICIP